ncbi:MAG: hypothetical protein QNJ08_07940 [Crocosphaera sp.]|nr:hypothetical protein [Crocosphaera sp.]
MSAKFCLFIPSKILQLEKHFSEKMKRWIKEYRDKEVMESGFDNYKLLRLPDFINQSDVNADLPPNIYHRYHVIDWGVYFPPSYLLKDFLTWLANIYSYGEVALLKYWSDNLKRFPPIKVAEINHISDVSVDNLTLDQVFFFPLKKFYETG